MNNAERIKLSQEKVQATINSAMEYGIKHLESFIVALVPLMKGNVYRQWTKKGPGRKHQNKSKAQLREDAYKRAAQKAE